jgi:hydrogen peroxide-dependent heme synthase
MTANQSMSQVPLTLEGSWVLHQMFRLRWAEWRALSASDRQDIAAEAAVLIGGDQAARQQSAVFQILGHKGDLMFIHFCKSFEQLHAVEHQLEATRLHTYLEPASSYVSVIELGLYDSSVKLYRELNEKGTAPHTPEWNAAIEETLKRQREAMQSRLFPEIPNHKHVCFYPMDRKRGEHKNWYTLPIEERQRQMEEHGLVGRRYAGKVRQIITGSIGFDDWEWGVDLFSDDPLVFKKLIYEMRFDQVSAEYALFGSFYVGSRMMADEVSGFLGASK